MRFSRLQFLAISVSAAIACLGGISGYANDAAGSMGGHGHPATASSSSGSTSRRTADYNVPDIRLVRQDGALVRLRAELDDGRPVILSFIFTSCGTVCPLLSHTLSQVQARLGVNRDRVHIVSISIDPEEDTPARLREYASTYQAGPEWQHYTGTVAASETVQRAFDVYRGAKMDHAPATLVRPAPGAPWVRIDGFATADQILAELPDPARLHAAR